MEINVSRLFLGSNKDQEQVPIQVTVHHNNSNNLISLDLVGRATAKQLIPCRNNGSEVVL